MKSLAVPAPLREKVTNAGADSLMEMFADAHRLATESFERRLAEEVSAVRLDISNLRFELLKWSCLVWIGQLAAVTAIVSLLMRGMK